MDSDQIEAVTISLTAGERQLLFISASRDGALHRKGTARLRDPDMDLAVGHTDDPVFADIVAALPDDFTDNLGTFALPEQEGTPMLLRILLSTADGDREMAISYGSDSLGPPEDIVRFVLQARAFTDPWYQRTLAAT